MVAMEVELATLVIGMGIATFAEAMLAGASFGEALQAGVIAGVSAAAFHAVGASDMFGYTLGDGFGQLAMNALANGVVGGITNALAGGNFGHGFAAAGFSAFAKPGIRKTFGISKGMMPARVVARAVIGGTISERTGGKFANGAVTAAFSQLFNEERTLGRERNVQEARKKIAEVALSKKGDESYAYESKVDRFPEKSWKCNKFVSDVIEEAGITAPDNPGGNWPAQANVWADKNHHMPGWEIVENPMPGDVAAIPREGTGHVGIYIEDRWGSDVMAANRDGVGWSGSHLRNDWSHSAARSTGDTVYRRYVGSK